MPARSAHAVWNGGLKDGSGTMRLGSGAFEGAYSFATRFEEKPGTNPEELIGAALAGCFSMALSGALGREPEGGVGRLFKSDGFRLRIDAEDGDGQVVVRID